MLDDLVDIINNPAVNGGLADALAKNPFRLITYLTYWFNVSLLGMGAPGLHYTNLLFHILTGIFLLMLVREWLGNSGGAAAGLAAAGFFLLNPLMGSSVLYVSARPTILVTLGAAIALWGMIAYMRDGRGMCLAAAWIGAALSMFSKESGIVVPFIMLVAGLKGPERRRAALSYVPMFLVAGAYAVLRLGYRIDLGDRGSTVSGPAEYLFTQATVIPVYLSKFLWPVNLGLEWEVAGRKTIADPAVIGWGLFLITSFAAALWLSRRSVPAFCLAMWIPISMAVESSVIPLADFAFDHRFYFPGAAAAGLISIPAGGLWARSSSHRRLAAIFIMVVLCMAALTARRSFQWSDLIGAWNQTVKIAPDNYRARYNLGHNLLEKGEYRAALPQLNAAVRFGGKVPEETALAFNARGLTYLRIGSLDEAAADFTKAMELSPGFGDPVLHLGVTYLLKGDAAQAVKLIKAAQTLLPGDPKVETALKKALAMLALQGGGGSDTFPK